MRHLHSGSRAERGFTLVELSVVMIVVALIGSAAVIGRDVYRSAVSQRMYSDFLLGWRTAYQTYITATHNVQPGDNPSSPHYAIGGVQDVPMCGNALINKMLALGITLPEGRGAGYPDRFAYIDQTGTPHEMAVCLETVMWGMPGTSVGAYVATPKHVLLITGITPEVATTFDSMTDGHADARFGDFREKQWAGSTSAASQPWSITNTTTMGNVAAGETEEVIAMLKIGG